MKIVYFDIHVIYDKTTFNKIIEKMKSFNYSGLYVSLEEKDLKFKNDILELCKDNLLEFKSRYDLDFEDYRKNKSIKELKKKFNYISLKNVNWNKMNPVNLKNISILEMDIIPNILIRKISKSAKHIVFEFNLSNFNKTLETNPQNAMKQIHTLMNVKKSNLTIKLSNGAQHPLDIKPPLQLLYTSQKLIGANEEDKKYIGKI